MGKTDFHVWLWDFPMIDWLENREWAVANITFMHIGETCFITCEIVLDKSWFE
jgi:hypothetical protein